ncbi:TMEM165/GDT1 family protein [Candidatus Neomarinimicrobiota bacterium]
MQYLITVFITVFLAELGDKTQLAILLYSSKADTSKTAILVAASLALISTTFIAVVLGDRLSRLLNPKYLEPIAAIGFIIIGVIMLITNGDD